MRLVPRSTFATIVLSMALGSRPINAQSPAGSATLSAGAVADSLAVLKQLDVAIATNPRDAASWFRRGMIAWSLYERDRSKPPIAGLDWTRLGRMADTSLRIAADIEPENGEYRLMVGRYLLLSGVSFTRLASYGMFQNALESARLDTNPRVLAETAVEAGRVHWRRYDALAHRVMETGGVGTSERSTEGVADQGNRAAVARDALRQIAITLDDNLGFIGEMDYRKSEALFREAFDADRTFERGYRQFAMLLVERNRWQELSAVARARIDAVPGDAWAWLTLGLSLQRADVSNRNAAAAFERGMSMLSAGERMRLDRLERLLKPADSARVARLDSATRAAVEKLYWTNADPLWSREGNEIRAEFLARITYAELRWTAEEMRVRGAETDRGNVHIRYGPPDLLYAMKGADSEIMTTWVYNAGLRFQFRGLPTFATAEFPSLAAPGFVDMMAVSPVRWDNIRTVRIDSIPSQVARFRATADSVDLYVATRPPIAEIRAAADVAGSVRTDFWLMSGGIRQFAHDSAKVDVPGVQTYVHRVPTGAYVFRTEATADGALYAGRALAMINAATDSATGFTTSGFGMSDVLMAASASARGTAQRWRDLTIQPILTTVVQRGEFALVWENYDLGADAGSARYQVTVTIERQRSLAGRIAAQIIGRAGSALGVDRQPDRLTIHYERSVPHAPVVLDNVALGLAETPAGSYAITVGILDRVTGRATSRAFSLTVLERKQ
jgi:GWxTD domain-containing protein